MPDSTRSLREETDSLLETLSAEKREYLLWRLATDKLAGEQSSGPIPVRCPDDGAVVEYLRKVTPPSEEDKAVMIERAKRMDRSAGRGTREILDRMKAGEVGGVKPFIR